MQICDPARPTTMVSGGPGRRRWEFMRLPDESIEDLNSEATAWRLLAPRVRPRTQSNGTPCIARRWDAARGRCFSPATRPDATVRRLGMRPAWRCHNLAWKLDLVLRDAAPQRRSTRRGRNAQHVRSRSRVGCLGGSDRIADPPSRSDAMIAPRPLVIDRDARRYAEPPASPARTTHRRAVVRPGTRAPVGTSGLFDTPWVALDADRHRDPCSPRRGVGGLCSLGAPPRISATAASRTTASSAGSPTWRRRRQCRTSCVGSAACVETAARGAICVGCFRTATDHAIRGSRSAPVWAPLVLPCAGDRERLTLLKNKP